MAEEKDGFSAEKSKKGVNGVFDDDENGGFDGVVGSSSRVFDTKRRVGGRSKAEYRRVHRNIKSSRRYWLERNRRKLVWDLLGQHLTYKQIASEVGVSERTVKRDMARIRPYYERRMKHLLKMAEQQRQEDFEAKLQVLSLKERHKLLDSAFKAHENMLANLLKPRSYNRGQLSITIDLDDVSEGLPKIEYKPQPPFNAKYPFKINLVFKKNGITTQVQELLLGGKNESAPM